MSKIIGDEACPRCRHHGRDLTGNHLMIFEDGGKYCNRCGYGESPEGPEAVASMHRSAFSLEEIALLEPGPIPSRKLGLEAMQHYGHRVAYNTTTREPTHIFYPRFSEGGVLMGWKQKDLSTKSFISIGSGKNADLAGMEVSTGNKLCIVTEGEDDMVAAKHMLYAKGKDYTVVSLPNGALSRINEYSVNWLNEFDSIVIATDMDQEGDEAANKLVDLITGNKCRRAQLPAKDANECLMQDLTNDFFSAIMDAKTITPDGVVLGQDTWERFIDDYRNEQGGGIPYPDGWDELNDMIYGVRTGELDTFTSGSGMGKTQLLRELMYHLAHNHQKRVGVLSLEEPLSDTVLGQMSVHAKLPLHLPEARELVTDEELRMYWEATFGTGNYVAYDHFGSLGQDTLVNKIRYMAAGVGCQYVILDHLSIVVSEYAQDGDERKAIDEIMTKLKRLTQELNIWIGLVVHLRKAGGVPFELGSVPSVDDLRGSGGIKQLSNQVIALSRNQQDIDLEKRNTSLVTVLKSRFTGKTGPACLLKYDHNTGCMSRSPMSLDEYKSDSPPLTKFD